MYNVKISFAKALRKNPMDVVKAPMSATGRGPNLRTNTPLNIPAEHT